MGKKAKKKAPQRVHLMTLRVGPDEYEVYEHPEPGSLPQGPGGNLLGYCSHPEAEIVVKSSQRARRKRASLFHEVLHAVDWEYGIGLSEKQTRKLETGLLNVIDDNPDLLGGNHGR